jgi:hypothetical protein
VNSHPVGTLQYLLDKYIYCTVKSYVAKLHMKEDEQPRFFKARTVHALWEAIEDELDRLEHEGILEKVTHSE